MTVALGQSDIIDLENWGIPDLDLQRPGWDVPARENWQIESRFRQTSVRAKTSTLFSRFNRHYLSVRMHRRKKELPEKVIDLTFVEPQPREIKDYHYKLWFAAACLLILPAAIFALVPLSWWWLIAPVGAALVLVAVALRRHRHCFEFLALNSDVVLFTIDAWPSDDIKRNAFIEAMCASIVLGQRQLPEGKGRIPRAVSEMRRLSAEGVITKEQYEAIKRNWFAL
ncbi:hypothetical protein [Marinobacter caseinilyticus]|uniref:hypothetical protein n=1 Tax=Marinobacter caseinilyticus TaxID=2692195 RepID=UPI001408E153|nr:hypothetical protein [Marinobacter caseinilyticus]